METIAWKHGWGDSKQVLCLKCYLNGEKLVGGIWNIYAWEEETHKCDKCGEETKKGLKS